MVLKYRMQMLILILLIPAISSDEFTSFQEQFGIDYQNQEEKEYHKQIFFSNLAEIQRKNIDELQYTLGVNEWTDRIQNQIKSRLNVKRPNTTNFTIANSHLKKIGFPSELDWRKSCIISKPKNQGSCGACWAFTTVSNAESYLNLMRETNYDLSEEYVLQCTISSDCSGGYPQVAMNLIKTKGLPKESAYPYKGQKYGIIGKPTTAGICSSSGHISLPTDTIVDAYSQLTPQQVYGLISYAPIVTYFYSTTDFIAYESGVYACPITADKDLNHAVEVIGYDSVGNYIIKNYCGTKWGINGYAYINKNRDCGISMYAYQFVNGVSNRTNTKACPKTEVRMLLFTVVLLIMTCFL